MIGIRREDKSKWEARVPLTPADVRRLTDEHGVQFRVQNSPTRAFKAEEFTNAGAQMVDHLHECPIIIGVKEMPFAFFEPNKTYVFFSHTIKAQPYNMKMLKRIVELGCTLIDYERIVDEHNRRLVAFGRFAGLAGMIDTLWSLGQRLKLDGIDSPFADVRRAYDYDNLDHAKQEISKVGDRIRSEGLPAAIQPFVCGFAGYGNVSLGAQEIFDLLPMQTVEPDAISSVGPSAHECTKTVFCEEHLVELDGAEANRQHPFDVQDYYDHPQKYRSKFFPALRHLSVLVNCIYWEPKYPKLVTCEQLKQLYQEEKTPRLKVIGDITCDIEGSIECNMRATDPGDPVYVYEPLTGDVKNGLEGNGPVIMAVDILPCELPKDSSAYFGTALSPFIPGLDRIDLSKPLEESGLPAELQRATIVYKGELTKPYRYLAKEIRD